MRNALKSTLLVWLIAVLVLGCDRQDDQTATEPPPGAITGRERLYWDQQAPSPGELSQYTYVLYVDNTPVNLQTAACGVPSGTPPTAVCSSPLPPLRPGTHTLELGTRLTIGGVTLESVRSAPLVVTVIGSGTAGSVSQGALAPLSVALSEADYVVETVVAGLDRPVALAGLSSNRLLVAERGGVIRIAEGDVLRAEPSTVLADFASGDDERVSLAVDHDFANTRLVYVAYAARDGGAGRIGRVVRFREAGGRLVDSAVVLEGLPADASPPRLRMGPDGALYVATTAANPEDADDLGSDAGKILRFAVTGGIPADNPFRSSPVFSLGHEGATDFDWEPSSNALWYAESSGKGLEVGRTRPGSRPSRVTLLEGIQAADIAFHSGATPSAWRGSLLLASKDDGRLYRLSGLSSSPPRPVIERVPLTGFGRIAAVLSAADGLYFATGNSSDASGRRTDRIYRVRDKTVESRRSLR
jgi:glucose/arabinose dehydrogenase